MMYIYPDRLKAKATMWLWQLRDLTIVGVGVLLSVLAITQTGIVIPAILTAVYGFLTIRFEDTSILDFLCYAGAFFFRQQFFDFMIRPTNLSVLSDSSVGARVYALMNVLKGVAEIEMLCLNSRENFEENKSFLRKRAEEERNPVVRKLLERDQSFLDRIQVQMATAREFLIIIRLHNEKGNEVFSYLDRIEKSLKEQGFSTSRAGSEDIKRIMAVYYEQNVTSEKFEDFDGERWIIPDD